MKAPPGVRVVLVATLASALAVHAQDGGSEPPPVVEPAPPPDPDAAIRARGAPVPSDEKLAAKWFDIRVAERRTSEALAAARAMMDKETRPELQWRITQVIMSYAEVNPQLPDDERLKIYNTCERLTRACIAARGPPHCEFFLGSALGRQATVKGLFSSLRAVRHIEATWLAGLERAKGHPEYVLDGAPLEAFYYYALGVLYRIMPDMWIVKMIAGVRGDLDKAIALHRKSHAMRPDLSTKLELGVALMCSGHKRDNAAHMAEGRALLETVLTIPSTGHLDELDKKNTRYLLEHPNQACGYSRDKMQDVDDVSKAK